MALAIPLIIPGVLFVIFVALYNGLISKKNRLKSAESTIDIMFKKRHDLIPNLVASVKEYMEYESGTLTEITKLREELVSSESLSADERNRIEGELSNRLSGLRLSFENYPDLKASTNFVQLQGSLNEVEEQLSAARRAYNAAVVEYNNGLEMFPSNLMAGWMKLQPAAFIDMPEEVKQTPDVKGLFKQ